VLAWVWGKGKVEEMYESKSLSDLEGPCNFSSRQLISLIIQGNGEGRERTPHEGNKPSWKQLVTIPKRKHHHKGLCWFCSISVSLYSPRPPWLYMAYDQKFIFLNSVAYNIFCFHLWCLSCCYSHYLSGCNCEKLILTGPNMIISLSDTRDKLCLSLSNPSQSSGFRERLGTWSGLGGRRIHTHTHTHSPCEF
jgi:hypothetical protein